MLLSIYPGLFSGLIAVYIIIFAVVLGLTIWMCVWVYKDAKKRGQNEVLWLIVVLVGGCIGLIIYLIVRDQEF